MEVRDVNDAPPELGVVARFVQAKTGIGLEGDAHERAAPTIARCMEDAGFDRPEAYVAALERDPNLFDALADQLTIGESYFFRHAWHFDVLAGPILDEVRARRAGGGAGVRLWSAGCSDGQEVYSAAITLAEAGALEGATLLATDLSVEALERARAGRYRDWALRGPAAERAKAWMRREGSRWHLSRRIRDAVLFAPHNLVDPPPLGASELDVIFCRNVLIYFDRPAIAKLAARLAACLRPGGWLLTGPSDPPLGELADLEPKLFEGGVVYRHRARSAAPARPPAASPPPDRSPTPAPRRRSRPPGAPLDRLQRLARLDPAAALEGTERALADHGDLASLRWLRANLLVALDRPTEAIAALEAIAADADAPGLALASYVIGSLRAGSGQIAGARAAFERALSAAAALPAESVLAHSDGQRAGALAEAARRQLVRLSGAGAP